MYRTFGHGFHLDKHQHPVRILSVAPLIPVGYPRGAVAVADSVTGGASLRLLLHSLPLGFRYGYGEKRRCVCEPIHVATVCFSGEQAERQMNNSTRFTACNICFSYVIK